MGMYTEIVIKCDIECKDMIALDVLNYMFNNGSEPSELPEHAFFKCDRWDMIGSCSSYYHIPATQNFFDGSYLFSRSDIKNYDDEIRLFFDWVSQYINSPEGVCIGYSWYEEEDKPELVILGEDNA